MYSNNKHALRGQRQMAMTNHSDSPIKYIYITGCLQGSTAFVQPIRSSLEPSEVGATVVCIASIKEKINETWMYVIMEVHRGTTTT